MTGRVDWGFLGALVENHEQRERASPGSPVLLGDGIRAEDLFFSHVPGKHVSGTLMGVNRKV